MARVGCRQSKSKRRADNPRVLVYLQDCDTITATWCTCNIGTSPLRAAETLDATIWRKCLWRFTV